MAIHTFTHCEQSSDQRSTDTPEYMNQPVSTLLNLTTNFSQRPALHCSSNILWSQKYISSGILLLIYAYFRVSGFSCCNGEKINICKNQSAVLGGERTEKNAKIQVYEKKGRKQNWKLQSQRMAHQQHQ